jgi:hypothetical protein
MKKLLTTTALIGLVASSVSSYAETKVTGSIEQTYNANSVGGTDAKSGSDGLGQETNLKISSSKELDNGMNLSGGFNSEDGAIDSSSIVLSSGALSFGVGADFGQHIHSNINPRVDDNPFDAISLSGDDGMNVYQVHDKQHIGLAFKTDMGTVALNYAPGNTSITASDGNTASTGGSGTEISFKGNLGVDGLTVLLGQETISADTNGQVTAATAEEVEKVAGFKYGQGAWAVGYTHRTFDDGTTSAVENSIDTVTAISATYAISDSLSIGYENLTGEFESSALKDEESDAITVGYNLGGLGVSVMYVESDNIAGGSTAQDTQEELQIRTVYKF